MAKRVYQPPPDIVAMLDADLEPALVAVNKPPSNIAKLFTLHFGAEVHRDLHQRLADARKKAKEKEPQS